MFGERGFESATVAEIARRCNLTTGAIYARWADKRDLFIAAVEWASNQRMQFLADNAEAGAVEKLAALSENLLSSTRDHVDDVWSEACSHSSRDESIHAVVAHAQAKEARLLAEILDEGKASGLIDSSLSTAAMVFVCQSLGTGAQLVLRSSAQDQVMPTDSELIALMGRLVAAIAPASPDDQPA